MNLQDFEKLLEQELPKMHGWCSIIKAMKFIEYILNEKPNLCVEIGVFGGSSLIPQGMALKQNGSGKVFGIDPWKTDAALEEMTGDENRKWWGNLDLEDIYKHCQQNITKYDLSKHCRLIRDKSENVIDQFDDESIDILHIDGNHSEAVSYKDATLYLPKVKPNGIIFFDDIYWTEGDDYVTTRKAISFLFEHCEKVDLIGNDCLVFRKR